MFKGICELPIRTSIINYLILFYFIVLIVYIYIVSYVIYIEYGKFFANKHTINIYFIINVLLECI